MGLWGSGPALKEEGSVGSYVASKCALYFVVVVQMLSCVGLFVTPMDHSMPNSPVLHCPLSLSKFMTI